MTSAQNRVPDKISPHRIKICFLMCFVFSFLAFLLAGSLSAAAKNTGVLPGGWKNSCQLLNSGCEAPAAQLRLGEQLRLNVRNHRARYQYNLLKHSQNSNCLPGKPFEPLKNFEIAFCALHEEVSTYQIYSRYTLPVRAGPLFTCRQAILV